MLKDRKERYQNKQSLKDNSDNNEYNAPARFFFFVKFTANTAEHYGTSIL
jgi:hypothetical protein